MGNKNLEPQADEESSYKVIAYKGQELPQDILPLIKSSFIKTLRYGNEYFKLIDGESFSKVYPKYVEALIKKPKTLIRIAILSDETILGWSMCEDDVLHYVWVKKEVWRQGIGKSLVPESVTQFTHITNKGLSIWAKDFLKHLRFNPFA